MTDGSEMLAALSDTTRRTVLELLRDGPATVGEIAEQLPVSRPAVSQHLRVLKDAGLVDETRSGTRHYFHLNPRSFEELRSHIDSMWRDALTAFSRFASKEKVNEQRKRKASAHPKKRSRRLSD